MRSFALLASLAAVFVAQLSTAEQVTPGFAPACSTAACPHPVAAVYPTAPQLVGPRLFPPALNAGDSARVPVPLRDHNIRVASNDVVSAKTEDKGELLQQKLAEAARLQSEIQKLRAELGQSQQILIKVRALEVSLTKLRKLGVGADSSDLRKAIEASSKSSSDGQPYTNAVGTPSSFVDSLIANNVARVLAEPNIVTLSGRPAQFFCGSEIPLPGREANATVEFRKCGTEVDLLAISTGDSRVRLEVRARVSECDYGHSIRVGDSSIPGLRVRQCDTAVETKFGQPVVLDGTVEKRFETIDSEAGRREVENEIALVFVVTPELVDPLDGVTSEGVVKPVRATQTK